MNVVERADDCRNVGLLAFPESGALLSQKEQALIPVVLSLLADVLSVASSTHTWFPSPQLHLWSACKCRGMVQQFLQLTHL